MKISNSEAQDYALCRRRWYYGYAMNLSRIEESRALARGSAGHEILGAYYGAIARGTSEAMALDQAYDVADRVITPELEDDAHAPLLWIIDNYFDHEPYVSHKWVPVLVEDKRSLQMDGYVYNWTADVVFRNRQGRLILVDHKFLTEFYGQTQLNLGMQMPRYVAAARAEGMQVRGAEYNMVRTKKVMKSHRQYDRGHQEQIPLGNTRVERAFLELDAIAQEIAGLRELEDLDTLDVLAVRTAQEHTCKNCAFKNICDAQLNDRNWQLIRDNQYTRRTERYEDGEDNDETF